MECLVQGTNATQNKISRTSESPQIYKVGTDESVRSNGVPDSPTYSVVINCTIFFFIIVVQLTRRMN